MSFYLAHGSIGIRDRELLILRNAWLSQAPFEWGEHVRIAKGQGITGVEIQRIIEGSSAPGWSEHDRALLRTVEELHQDAMISDATWTVLARTLDEKQLVELPLLIGQYLTIAYTQNSLRMRLRDGNEGLSAR
jgi:alkylhydroperoxidase family enzyme